MFNYALKFSERYELYGFVARLLNILIDLKILTYPYVGETATGAGITPVHTGVVKPYLE